MSFVPSQRPLERARAAITDHPDLSSLAVVWLVAAGVRTALAFRAPMFLLRDSGSYFLPAHDLAYGLGFDLSIRRTPLYPWFLTGTIVAFGEELQAIGLVQHVLGIATVGLAYTLGRLLFGRAAGMLAGLLTALDGTLLVSERYVMPEALLVPLLLLTLVAATVSIRRQSNIGFVVTGLILGLSVLCKPVSQALVPVIPLVALLSFGSLRRTLRPTALLLAGLAIVLVPWMLRNWSVHGSPTTAGALGQTLVARTAKHDTGFRYYDQRLADQYGDRREATARQTVQSGINQRLSDGVIYRRVQERLGLTDAEANTYLRNLAIEVILAQPYYYLQGTARMTWQLLVGEVERLSTDWKTMNARLSRDEWEERVEHLLGKPTATQQNEFPRAEAIVGFYQPATVGPLLALLALIGTVLATRTPSLRSALLPGVTVLALLTISAALDGPVPRYRYPADPLIAVAAMGGLVGMLRLVKTGLHRFRGRSTMTKRNLALTPRGRGSSAKEKPPESMHPPLPEPHAGRAP